VLNSKGSIDQAQVYTDLSGLAKLGSAARKNDPAALAEVAGQFESLFMNLMLKSMRDANAVFAKGNFLNSSNVNTYQQMLDQQLSVSLADKGSMGLAKILMKQLSPPGQALPKSGENTKEDLTEGFDALLHSPSENKISADNNLKELSQGMLTAHDARAGVLLTESEGSVTPAPDDRVENDSAENNNVDCAMLPEFDNTATALLAQNFTISDQSNMQPLDVFGSEMTKNPAQVEGFSGPASSNQQAFIQTLLPTAKYVVGRSGVDPKMLIAQAALETGWGKHVIKHPNGSSSYNLFNIKADENWTGKTVTKDVSEYRDGVVMKQRSRFRAYDSFTESFKDYMHLVQHSERYAQAMSQRNEPQAYIKQLHRAGYATDPHYSTKVNKVYQRVIATEGT
jgi:flagellar protein FlgJ